MGQIPQMVGLYLFDVHSLVQNHGFEQTQLILGVPNTETQEVQSSRNPLATEVHHLGYSMNFESHHEAMNPKERPSFIQQNGLAAALVEVSLLQQGHLHLEQRYLTGARVYRDVQLFHSKPENVFILDCQINFLNGLLAKVVQLQLDLISLPLIKLRPVLDRCLQLSTLFEHVQFEIETLHGRLCLPRLLEAVETRHLEKRPTDMGQLIETHLLRHQLESYCHLLPLLQNQLVRRTTHCDYALLFGLQVQPNVAYFDRQG